MIQTIPIEFPSALCSCALVSRMIAKLAPLRRWQDAGSGAAVAVPPKDVDEVGRLGASFPFLHSSMMSDGELGTTTLDLRQECNCQ